MITILLLLTFLLIHVSGMHTYILVSDIIKKNKFNWLSFASVIIPGLMGFYYMSVLANISG